MNKPKKQHASAVDFSWMPPKEEWDFRSVTNQECRVAAYWEYEREYITKRIIRICGEPSPACPPIFRQAAREFFPRAWNTLAPEQRARIVESFIPTPALQVCKLSDFLTRIPPPGTNPEITSGLLLHARVIIPNFRVQGVEEVIKEFDNWARREAGRYPASPRAHAAALPFSALKWLAVARLEAARNKVEKLTIQMARDAVVKYQRAHPQRSAGEVFPVYDSDGAWLKAYQSAYDCMNKAVRDPSTLLAELA